MSDAVLTLEALIGCQDDTKGKKRSVQRGDDTNEGSGETEVCFSLLAAAVHHGSLNYSVLSPCSWGNLGGMGRVGLRAFSHNIFISHDLDLVVCVFLIGCCLFHIYCWLIHTKSLKPVTE